MFEVKKIEDKEQWDKLLARTINSSVFSTWEWGEFKKSNRQIDRLAFFKKGNFVGLSQITLKEVMGFKLAWGSSGIGVTKYSDLPKIVDSLGSYYDLKKTVIRFNFFDKATGENCFHFDEIEKLRQVPFSVNSGYSVWFDEEQMEADPKKYDRNTRYYLNKALKNDLEFDVSKVDLERFEVVHNEMAKLKNKLELSVSLDELKNVAAHFGENIFMGTVTQKGEVLSSCLVLTSSAGKSFYFLAGATQQGRDNYASFFMVHNLLPHLKKIGIKLFDFAGISPILPSVKGINRFKMSFGGEVTHYIGERNVTDSKLLNCFFNAFIWFRFRGRS